MAPEGVAIVTGSDSGIGKAAGVPLAEASYDVGITFHADEDGARGTAKEVEAFGRRAAVRKVDLSDAREGRGSSASWPTRSAACRR